MKKIVFWISTICMVQLLFLACAKQEKITVDYRSYAPDMDYRLTEPDQLTVSFKGSVAKLEDMEKEALEEGLISIEPAIKGSWHWDTDTDLVFTPLEDWQLATRYKVKFSSELFPEHITVKNEFSFTTSGFILSINEPDFYIDPENPSVKRVTFGLKGSHPLATETVEKAVSMKLELLNEKGAVVSTKDYAFEISYNDTGTVAYVISEPVEMPIRTSIMKITVAGGIKSLRGGSASKKMEASVDIPGMSDYVRITSIGHALVQNQQQNYDQVLTVETKGSIAGEEIAENITVWQLPVNRATEQGWKESKNHHWSVQEVTDLALSQSQKIPVHLIPTEEKHATLNSFTFDAEPNRYLYVKISGDLDFLGGYKYSDTYETIVRVKEYPTELGILSEGTILSLAGSKKMALYSRGVSEVEYSLSRIMPKDVNHLVSMSNQNMKNFEFSSYNFDEDNISETITSRYVVPDASKEEISYFSYDFSNQLKNDPARNLKNGLFIFEAKQYKGNISDKRFILVTDLGFFVKRNSDLSYDVFVQSIATGRPVPNATVRVIGLNGNTLVSTRASSDGHAHLPSLTNYRDEHSPTAFIVETANDLSFMPYSQRGRTLDYSNFDVGGVYGATEATKVSAYMFSDRGMYRPGDTVNLGLIVKSGDWNLNLRGLPLELVVTDSSGSTLYSHQLQLSDAGFEEVSFSTREYSPTGLYVANLYLLKEMSNGDIRREYLADCSVKVEEFLPDTLTLSAGFEPLPKEGWINPGDLTGTISLKNLFGTPAAGNEVKAQLFLTPGFPNLRAYKDYRFADPYSRDNSYQEFLGSASTNDKGQAEFTIDLQKFQQATYRMEFYVEAFEKGSGRSVTQQSSLYVSPLQHLIGYKADGDLSYINSGSKRKVDFIAIDQALEKIAVNDLTLTLEEKRYVSTLMKQPNGLYKYQSVQKKYPLEQKQIAIPQEGLEYYLPTDKDGEFVLTISDKEGLVYNSFSYSVVGSQNIARSLTRTAELDLRLERSDLASGGTARLFIKAPYAGSGLITIERDKVYSWKWFTTTELSSQQVIEIPKGLEGNAYINVMFTRDSNSQEIFMSPFCYGTVPFSIDRANRTNTINLQVPEEVKSGEELKITYSARDRGKIVLYAVDEGILQVANYTNPNPLSFFFQKRALEVRTGQLLDLILPDYEILKTIPAAGGGAGMDELARNLNPFKRKQNKPVAFWSGVLDCGPEEATVSYEIPSYFNGSIRVIAVAVSPNTMGVATTSALARNTFIINPNTPLAVAPGDQFDVSVTVTNNHRGSGDANKVLLTATPSTHLEIVGEKSVQLTIAEGKDATTTFKVKARDTLGGGEILFTAQDAQEKSVYAATMSIRPSMPYQTWIESGKSDKKSAELAVEHKTYEEYAQRQVSLSFMPTAFSKGFNFYLQNYPYGCSEQITSKAYPYVCGLEDSVLGVSSEEYQGLVNETIAILQSRMMSDGHIGYWTNKSPVDNQVTIYCAEFLTDAQKNGYYVPSSFLSKVLSAVEDIASSSATSSGASYAQSLDRAYAIYVLTKNEIVTTPFIESLERDMKEQKSALSEYPALYLAASYAMLQQSDKAEKLVRQVKPSMKFDSSWAYHNDLHYVATYLDILSQYFPHRIKDQHSQLLETFCEYIDSMYYNTYSTAAACRALASFASMAEGEQDKFSVQEQVGKEKSDLSLEGEATLQATFSKAAEKLIFSNKSDLPMYYQLVQGGYELEIPKNQIKDGLEVHREYLSLDGKKLSSIKLGDEILVKLSFRSTKEGYINNVAIIDLQPAGLEANIQSVRDHKGSWKSDYVDVREDRVVLYGTVTDKISTFTYRARAINTGTFVVPPMFAESRYNKDIRGLSPQSPIVIE
ncbi:MAG: alpha-2-macroglobulin family protein [Treponema sp.]|nr:alpha-2-macroglobulin family protein [Treponema sp.]